MFKNEALTELFVAWITHNKLDKVFQEEVSKFLGIPLYPAKINEMEITLGYWLRNKMMETESGRTILISYVPQVFIRKNQYQSTLIDLKVSLLEVQVKENLHSLLTPQDFM